MQRIVAITIKKTTFLFHSFDYYFLSFTIFAIWAIVYKKYFLFKNLFLFEGYAVDTISQFYPIEFFRVSHLSSFRLPFWSFQFDLGTNIYPMMANFNPFDLLYLLFGADHFVEAIPLVLFLKFLSAAIFFYAFLQKIKVSKSVSFLGAVMYSFSGYMILNSHWYHYPNYAVFAAMFLYFFELWFQDSKWIYLVVLIGLVWLKNDLQLLQICFFGSFYVLYRCINTIGWSFRIVGVYFRLASIFILGVFLGAYYYFPDTYKYISSARVQSALSLSDHSIFNIYFFIKNFFAVVKAEELLVIFSRFLASDLLYPWVFYKGYRNFFEDSTLYIGIVSFTLFFFSFLLVRKKTKWLWIFPAVVLFLVIFPCFRFLLNACVSETFKYLSFYCGFFILFQSILLLNLLFCKNEKRIILFENKLVYLIIYLIFLSAILFIKNVYLLNYFHVHEKIFQLSLFFITVYFFLIFFAREQFFSFFKFAFFCLIIFETTFFAHHTVNSNAGEYSPFFEQRKEDYFNKNVNAAIKYIHSTDNNFYRIEKKYEEARLNDAIIQNYFGTQSYLGLINKEMSYFYSAYQLSSKNITTNSYRHGLGKQGNLQNLLNIKYFLCTNDEQCSHLDGFQHIADIQGMRIYKNEHVDSFGKFFSMHMDENTFQKLSLPEKRALVPHVVVSPIEMTAIQKFAGHSTDLPVEGNQEEVFTLTYWDQEKFVGHISTRQAGILFFPIPFDSGWRVRVNDMPKNLLRLNFGFSGVELAPSLNQEIVLYYRPPYLLLGIIVSIISLLLTLCLWLRFPRFSAQ